jgi:hypothetical protein
VSDDARTQGLVDAEALARWMDTRKLPARASR